MTSEQLMQMSLVSWVTNQGIGAAPTDPPIWWNISADHLLLSPPQTHQTIRKPTSQEELDLCCYQKCGFQPFQHPSLQLPKGLSAPDPPPWCRKRKQFFKGVQIWNYKMRGVRTMHVWFVCIKYLEVADYGKVPKGISYSSPNPRSRGASGEIMAVNKTLGIIYHLLAEKCRRESIIYIITYIILGLNSATMISSIK